MKTNKKIQIKPIEMNSKSEEASIEFEFEMKSQIKISAEEAAEVEV